MIRRASAVGVPGGTQPRILLSNFLGSDERHPVSVPTIIGIHRIEKERLIAIRRKWLRPGSQLQSARGTVRRQGEFKNHRKSRSRRGNEAESFFAPKSASLRRRLPFLNSPWVRRTADSRM